MKTKMNKFDALCMALELSITATSEKKSRECVLMAESIAQGMNEVEIERAKRQVLKTLKGN